MHRIALRFAAYLAIAVLAYPYLRARLFAAVRALESVTAALAAFDNAIAFCVGAPGALWRAGGRSRRTPVHAPIPVVHAPRSRRDGAGWGDGPDSRACVRIRL